MTAYLFIKMDIFEHLSEDADGRDQGHVSKSKETLYKYSKNGLNTKIFGLSTKNLLFSTKNFSRFLRKTLKNFEKMTFNHKKIAVIPQKINVLAQICGIT
jgi:hypothetical protein